MNVSIVSRKIDLTDSIKESIHATIEQFEKYSLDIIAVKAIITAGRKANHETAEIEFTIQLPHHDTIVIRQSDKDLYVAIDKAAERGKKVLRRHHDRITDKIHSKTNDKGLAAEIPLFHADPVEEVEDEIVASEYTFDKPVEVDEALEYLKDRNAMFVVFKDLDDKTRTLYRRKDGRFGLY
jgi:putative sigma-54 modulation protein